MPSVAQQKVEVDADEELVEDLPTGTELLRGSYVVQKYIASGGFGITYLATDSLDREIVLKECFPGALCARHEKKVYARSRSNEDNFRSIVDRFIQEARSLAKLNHPNIVGVHQVFEDNDTAYMALDYIEGCDLLDLLEDDAYDLQPATVVSTLTKLLDAIAYVHDREILHRDISPDNILIDTSGEPVLIDFGAAREDIHTTSRILTKLAVVKDGYSPHEFYIQGSDQSPSSDLYALAASFYHLIKGEPPIHSPTRLAEVAAGNPDPYEPLEGHINGYDQSFLHAIDKALKVLPKDRTQTAHEWLEMIGTPSSPDKALSNRQDDTHQVARTPRRSASTQIESVQVSTPVADVNDLASANADIQRLLTGFEVEVETMPEKAKRDRTRAAPKQEAIPQLTIDELVQLEVAQAKAGVESPEGELTTRNARERVAQTEAAIENATGKKSPVAQKTSRKANLRKTLTFLIFAGAAGAYAFTKLDLTLPSQLPLGLSAPSGIQPVTSRRVEFSKNPVSVTWAYELPFTTGGNNNLLIETVSSAAPSALQPGIEIESIDGLPAISGADLKNRIETTANAGEISNSGVSITLETSARGDQRTVALFVPVAPTVSLQDGTEFAIAYNGAAWTTTVIETDNLDPARLLIGDELVMYLKTEEKLTHPNDIFNLIDRETQSGTERFAFSVNRDGAVISAELSYSPSSYE
jgi:serine/threonine protein kinase